MVNCRDILSCAIIHFFFYNYTNRVDVSSDNDIKQQILEYRSSSDKCCCRSKRYFWRSTYLIYMYESLFANIKPWSCKRSIKNACSLALSWYKSKLINLKAAVLNLLLDESVNKLCQSTAFVIAVRLTQINNWYNCSYTW